ncbi:MAG TPA: YIP1 family protein [Telluria sp.]
MHPLRILLQMFYHPGPAFAALKRTPRSWPPLLLLAAGLAAIQFWYVRSVDQAWLRQHEAAGDVAISGSGLMWTVFAVSLLALPAGCALHAAYLSVAARLSGFPQRFSDWFAFSAWTSVPNLLLLPLMGFQIMSSGGQVSQEELSLASLNALALHLPYTHPWAGLATHLDLALIWTVVLTTTGLRAWTGRGTAACLALALLPVALVVGVWAVAIVVFG